MSIYVKRETRPLPVAHMSQGEHEWTEPGFCASVMVDGRCIAVVSNSTTLCLPDGSVRAPDATDEQILAAVLGDESVCERRE